MFLLPLLVVVIFAHWLVFDWAMRTIPRIGTWRRRLGWLVVAIPFTALVIRIYARQHHSTHASFALALVMIELTTIVIAAVPLLLVRALLKRNRAKKDRDSFGEAAARADETNIVPSAFGRREIIERAAGIAFLGGTGSLLGWGMVRGRHAFVIEEVVVKIAGLPRVLDGYTIAQVSDIHTGTFVGERELAEGFDRVIEARPDLIVATGDLIDFDASYAPFFARAFANLTSRARDGVAAILGNHDYYADAPEVTRALRAAGVDVLVNRGKRIRAGDGGGFALLGVDDMWARREGGVGPNLARAMSDVPPDAPRILLAHQPNYFTTAAGSVALQLSGHTHGGQLAPGALALEMFSTYVRGRYERDGSTLWINRGFGVAGPPTRVGVPPEVTKVVLVSG